ncbi:MAG: hypothetical protein AWU55_1954 [Halomonadaceae bacterium T82-2]|nr:MAG: hypothetical protein AWU55_1954 [Halomonadaceae bacterium T82-2]
MSLSRMPRLAMPLLVLSGLLSGCSLLPEREPVRLFTLSEPSLSASPGSACDLTLRVDTPSAGSPLDGPRLLIMPSPGEFQAYAGARWRDDAPLLVRDHLIEAFRLDGRLAAVVDDASRARSDATLASQLGAFYSRYRKGTLEVMVRLDVQLLDEANREVLASQRIEVAAPSDDDGLESVVEAFGHAADQLASELVDWTLRELASQKS